MHAIVLALSLLASSSSTSPPVVSPQLLVGKWRIENDGLYFFRANGTWECRAADIIDGGRWKLRDGHTLELIIEYFRSKPTHEIIVIDRVVHETPYVRRKYQREVWLKQPGP